MHNFLGIGSQVFWFIGKVEDVNDPLKIGRAKVRAVGLHSTNTKELPTSDLPWATVLLPTTAGGGQGTGHSPGLDTGATVMGMFLDGIAGQYPVIMGIILGVNQQDDTKPPTEWEQDKIDLPNASNDPCEAFKYFTDQGLSAEQAAGIVGNLMQESNLNSRILGDGTKSVGIAQWNNERRQNLNSFAQRNGTSPDDYNTQLAFVMWELKNTEGNAYRQLKSATSVEQAALNFSKYYERPGMPNNDARVKYAQDILNKCGVSS